MSNIPLAGQIYRHFKGNLYRVVTLAEHSETGEMLVIYQALYGEFRIYARPLSMFMERVDKEKYPQSTSEFRFELQKELISAPVASAAIHEPPRQEAAHKEEMPASDENAGGHGEEALLAQPQPYREDEAVDRTKTQAGEEEELQIDPLVLEFLDAGTYEQRLNILAALHNRITDEMINTMAIALDVEIEEGEDTERRFEELCACLHTLKRYEGSRLR